MANQCNFTDVRLLIFLFISVFYFDLSNSAILRFNTNNLETNPVQKVSLVGRADKSLERRRRSSSGTSEATDGKLDFKTKKLNGTAHHGEAYMHWSGNKSDDIFVLTRQRGENGYTIDSKLWQSRNYGDDYTEVVLSPSALITYFYVSPVIHHQLIFVDMSNKTLYITKDALKSHNKSVLSFSPDRLLLHPTVADWLLVYSFDERKVRVSMDFGFNWKVLQSEATYRVFWADPVFDSNNKTVHMEVQNTIGRAHYKACLIPDCEDITHTIDAELEGFDGMSMLVENRYIFIQQTTNVESLMLVSYKRGPFKKAYFPLNIRAKNFMLVNADEGQIFIAVSHHSGVNLYLSDATGRFFVETLKNVLFVPQAGWFQIDLQEIKGMPATYVANQHQLEHKTSRYHVFKTYISFDKGGNWSLIPVPPELKTECKSEIAQAKIADCHLHLYLDYSSMLIPGILSERNAPGLLMAHGNIGPYLTLQNVNVFISSDGGWTWARAPMEGLFKFNILDQGSVMTAIMNAQVSATKTVYYSLDDGLTWQNSTFLHDLDIRVDGVLNEPGITTLIESVYGHESSGSGWLLVTINFNSILTKKCKNGSDYMTWKPTDQFDNAGATCILGETIVYERKKPQSKCFNGKDYERPISKTACTCSGEDFECDFGYKYKADNFEECTKEDWFSPDMLLTECPEGHKYNISHGYRKVAVDKCHGGIETKSPYKMTEENCPLLAPAGLSVTVKQVVAATGSVITFRLKQQMGSKVNTTYDWKFGDHSTNSSNGFNNSYNMAHTYTSYGNYNVSVVARNKKGSISASVLVRVEDKITDIYVSIPWAVKAGVPMHCEVDVQGQYLSRHAGHVHFVWQFDNKDSTRQPDLTWNRNISHTYKPINRSSQSYSVSVEAINSVSTVYKTFAVVVFKEAIFVQLSFSTNVDYFNFATDIARRIIFLQFLKSQISDALGVGQNRFAVVLHTIKPLTAHVMIVPSRSAGNKEKVKDIKTLATELLDLVKAKALSLALDGIKDRTHFVKVTSAYIVTDKNNGPKPSSKGANMRPVYIAIPILIAAAVVTGLVLLYYRRKFRESRRYSLLRHQADSDHLLDNDDDDDPPLDLNPDFGTSDHRDIDDAHLDLGTGSLVVTTGNSRDDNTVNC